MLAPRLLSRPIEWLIQVADVGVDRAHGQPGGADDCRDVVDRVGVEDVGHVVADRRQCAEVDLGEAEFGDGRQRFRQRLVPEADGRAAQSAVVMRHLLTSRPCDDDHTSRSTVNSQRVTVN